ncbi:MAG TPA: polysaccharide ABC transporter ATP-binding protein, partial [Gemmatimonadales bacterium]|nr:polysaccharide ABC transporter ATP-binding protein [Gemmatimonadales bacterium]
MSDIALEMDGVYKKFKRGEIYDSLRDLIPAVTRRLLGRRPRDELDAREFWAVHDVSFQVRRGEALGVIGSNGAGKSTMLKLLSGIMRPTRGRLAVHGRLSALIEVSAGFHMDLTGRENIYLNGTILGMTRKEIASRFDQIVAFSGLESFIDTPVKRYSSGMFARLGFSVAAHVDPDILIVDEVLSVGDYVFQQKCMERMRAVIRGGATVIFVSHNLHAVAEMCGRALLLERGRAVSLGPADEVIRTYLSRVEARRTVDQRTGVFVTHLDVGDASGPRTHFAAGERARVDVHLVSRGRYERLAVVIGLKDGGMYNIFNVSSESLTGSSFTMEPDQAVAASFELDLHLAPGRYQFCTWVYR